MTKTLFVFATVCLMTAAGQRALAAAPTFTDAQISSIMMTANEAEIGAGKMAESKAMSKDVKEFAKMMVTEHTKNEADGKTLAKKLKETPTTNEMSQTLKKGADQKMAELGKMSGKDFDKAYMASQVEMHQQLLADLEQKLIPTAQSADMKSFLETTMTHVKEHLTHAQQIQTAMK